MTHVAARRPAKAKRARAEAPRTKVAKARRRASVAPAPVDKKELVTMTLRLEPAIRRGLELLQEKFVGTTLNGLMNVGLRIYVDQQMAALERDAEASLARIKRYRTTDPTFSKVFAAIAEEEASHGQNDPIEGVPFVEESDERPGPIVTAVRQLIRGHS